MPPSTKITKEMILETGYELVMTSGIESVNSRSIAKMLGCSTQPIFSQFPTDCAKIVGLWYNIS